MQIHRRRAAALGACLALALAAPVPGAVAAPGNPSSAPATVSTRSTRVLADGLTAPLLGLAVHGSRTYVSQSFAGAITWVHRSGRTTDLSIDTAPGTPVTGLDVGHHHDVWFLEGKGDPTGPSHGVLKRRAANGGVTSVADLAAYEAANNPDVVNSYGFQGLPDQCRAQFKPADPTNEEAPPGPDATRGDVDSNPYAVAVTRYDTAYVADAGGNDILRVSKHGHIRTAAVLPPIPFTVPSAEFAAALGLPACVVGATYNFEPVPTDVERHGRYLYVSALPGGPESEQFGARGAVFRINPRSGYVKRLASGFAGAVDLAVDHKGRIYVAELFASRISRVHQGAAVPVRDVPFPGAIEYANGRLYVTSHESLGFLQGQPTKASVLSLRP